MKCKNKEVIVKGSYYNGETGNFYIKDLYVIITNNEQGKTISIDNGKIQFTIPFEPIEKYLK